MKTLKTWNDELSERQLSEICRDLEDGQLMIWPTDTLYGVACDALNQRAIERVCRLKGLKPEKTPLSIVCHDISQAAEYARIDNATFRLIKENTPGQFTFLLNANSKLPKAFKGRKVVGIRIPACNIDRQIVEKFGKPLLTTSVEVDDNDYTVNPELIAERYDPFVDMMIDAGIGGSDPSTVVDCTGPEPVIIRQGIAELE